jgi:hypothetical protein
MALDVKVGSFNVGLGALGTDVPVTGVGFTPKAIIFWWTGRTEAVFASGSATIRHGLGFATSSTSFRAVAAYDADAVGTASAASGHRSDACILQVDDVSGTTPTAIGWADLLSMDADGFTIEIRDAFTVNLRVHYLALGGADINAEIVDFVPTGVAGSNQTVNTVSVIPKFVLFANTRITTAPPAVAGNSYMSLSMATAAGAYQWSGGEGDASGTGVSLSGAWMGECAGSRSTLTTAGSNVMENRATISFNPSPAGFTLNWTERAAAPRMFALVLGGPFNVHVGNTNTRTSIGSIVESEPFFTPKGLLLFSHGKAANAPDALSNNEILCIGATDGTTQLQQQYGSLQGNTTMFCNTAIAFDEILQINSPSTDAIVGEASFTSFDALGFTLQQTDADTVASLVGYVAFGDAPIVGYTLTAEAGVLDILGSDAGVFQNHALTAQTGTLDITGTDVLMSRGFGLTAQAGSMLLTGIDGGLAVARFLTAQSGAAGLTGTPASLLVGRPFTASPGTVPFTGISADLRATKLLSAQAGVLDVTGIAASLLAARPLVAQVGSIALTGVDASLIYTPLGPAAFVLDASAGVVAIVGVDAVLRAGWRLVANSAAMPVDGISATLRRTYAVDAQPVSIDIVGVSLNLMRGSWLDAQPEAVSISHVDASFDLNRYIEAQLEAIPIDGTNAMLFAGLPSFIAEPGEVPIVGVSADFLTSVTLFADAGETPIIGLPATMSIYELQFYNLLMQSGAIPINAMIASLQYSRYLSANAGEISIVGSDVNFYQKFLLSAQSAHVPIISSFAQLIGVEPGAHSTDLIVIELKDLHHHIGA